MVGRQIKIGDIVMVYFNPRTPQFGSCMRAKVEYLPCDVGDSIHLTRLCDSAIISLNPNHGMYMGMELLEMHEPKPGWYNQEWTPRPTRL